MIAQDAVMNGFKIGDANYSDHGYRVTYKDGYRSWSPKEAFEEAYRENGSLTFGDAINALKQGKRVHRKGWNGKGMFLFLLPAGEVPKSAIHDPALRDAMDELIEGDTFDALGSIRMWTGKAVLTGWLASQTDILEEDWEIIE